MVLKILGFLVACCLSSQLWSSPLWAAEEIISVPTKRAGVEQRVLVVNPDAIPAENAVILFVGSAGTPAVDKHGTERGGNTLYRGMDIFVREGITAVIVDVPSDRTSLWNYRTSSDHAEDIGEIIAQLKQRGARKVWLAGISMGSLSVANAARRLKAGGPDGAILMSSVINTNRNSTETVLSVPLDEITIPVLVVRNPADGCKSSPPYGAERIMDGLSHAPIKRMMEFSGGDADESGPCEAYAAHGFIGQEDKVLSAVAAWIKNPQ